MELIHQTLDLWEKGAYSRPDGSDFRPTLNTYVLDGARLRAAVLICPGGGYCFTSPREAEPIALQFNAAGFHAFVLDYSVAPCRHPQPLLDVSRAICVIRENAGLWNVDAAKIAVCGFSAGGHLAAGLGVHWHQPYLQNHPGITAGLNRPNALILSYPVITAGQFAHRGSFDNLLGETAGPELLREMSLEHQVNSDTPPTFFWHTFGDEAVPVENSLLFANALRVKGIPFELHIYPAGPHGLALATAETDNGEMGVYPHVASWIKLCVEWLQDLFVIPSNRDGGPV